VRYDALFFGERRRTTVLLAAVLIHLVVISVLGMILIKEDRTAGTLIACLAAVSSGLIATLLTKQSPARTVMYLANRDELRRLIRQLDLYVHTPESFDAKQVSEITRAILELLGKEEEERDPREKLPTDKQGVGVAG
jgi:hypothetical protein